MSAPILAPNTIVHTRDPEEHIVVAAGRDWEDFHISATVLTLLGKVIDREESAHGDPILIRNLYSIPLHRVVSIDTARARIVVTKAEG